jgi:hypothetical protein
MPAAAFAESTAVAATVADIAAATATTAVAAAVPVSAKRTLRRQLATRF